MDKVSPSRYDSRMGKKKFDELKAGFSALRDKFAKTGDRNERVILMNRITLILTDMQKAQGEVYLESLRRFPRPQ